MNTTIARRLAAGAALLAIAACGSATADNTGAGATSQPSTASVTVKAATVTGHGSALVAGSNGMTLYQFDMDTAGGGTSACTSAGGCTTTWPPLIVPAGTTPTAASGITGQLATFNRADGQGLQVTYNGHPVYFFSGDTKPGDSNGNYPHWSVVPAGSGAAASAPAGSSPSASSYAPGGY